MKELEQTRIAQTPEPGAPKTFRLGCYPNPFNAGTTIAFALPKAESVSLGIYDITGRLIKHLIQQKWISGEHQVVWDGRDNAHCLVASGIHFCRLSVEGTALTREMPEGSLRNHSPGQHLPIKEYRPS